MWRENEREGCMNLHYVWTTNLGFCYNTALPVGSNAKRETYGLSYGMGKLLFDIYKYEHNVPRRNTDKSTYQKKKKKKGTHKSKNVERQSTFPKNHQQLFEPYAQWYPGKYRDRRI